jgi:hypothetical protein
MRMRMTSGGKRASPLTPGRTAVPPLPPHAPAAPNAPVAPHLPILAMIGKLD